MTSQPNNREQPEPRQQHAHRDPNHQPTDPIDTYVDALTAGNPTAALSVLSDTAVFQSPFNTWRARHLRSVFHARAGAFANAVFETVIRDHNSAVILWRAQVSGAEVQGAEVLSLRAGIIDRVDVYLRPADVLAAVHQAMVKAWPR
jgi:hypothetical protein